VKHYMSAEEVLKAENNFMANKNLNKAKETKNDEFYTQYSDIQKEIGAYLEYNPDTFRNKIVYCNCDDPFESNFFRYFVLNFNKLGTTLLKIIFVYDYFQNRCLCNL